MDDDDGPWISSYTPSSQLSSFFFFFFKPHVKRFLLIFSLSIGTARSYNKTLFNVMLYE